MNSTATIHMQINLRRRLGISDDDSLDLGFKTVGETGASCNKCKL